MRKYFTFRVENIHCANCASKIEAVLGKQPYIIRVEINLMLKKIVVETQEEMDEEKLRLEIERLAEQVEKGVRILGVHEKAQVSVANKLSYQKVCLIVGFVLFGLGIISQSRILLLAAYVCIGYDIVLRAIRHLLMGKLLDENFLMTLATLAAFTIGEFTEAVAVMALYKMGESMQQQAVDYSQREIAKTMDIRPDFARLVRSQETTIVRPEAVKVGEVIEVRVGEKLPLDGVVVEGETMLDTSMLTGEAMYCHVRRGDQVLSGVINKEGIIQVKVTTNFKESTVSKILELVQGAASRKSKSEDFITKFARWYTPLVVGLGVIIAIVPSLVTGDWRGWLYTSITFLVISCPCAIVISVPLGFFAGLGEAARQGILVKGSNYLEALTSIDTVVLDKTGTITKGQFGVMAIIEGAGERQEILRLAATLEQQSNHPIAQSIQAAYKGAEKGELRDAKEIAGEGMVAIIDDEEVLVGNERLMTRYGITVPIINARGSHIYVAQNGYFMGCIVVADEIKEDSKEAVAKLKALGIKKVIMLTGDKEEIAKEIGTQIGADEVYGELLPQHKVEKLEEILKEGRAIFIGDGINDAPVLSRADVGIAMGGAGSDAAIEAADVVLMTDKLSSIGEALRIARCTKRIVMQNIVFALGVKVMIMCLGILGAANIWLAIFGDVGVALIAILNAIRILGHKGMIRKIYKTQ